MKSGPGTAEPDFMTNRLTFSEGPELPGFPFVSDQEEFARTLKDELPETLEKGGDGGVHKAQFLHG